MSAPPKRDKKRITGRFYRPLFLLSPRIELIHALQPACLIANNHHLVVPLPGEDIQCFERDVPGENKGGYSEGMSVSRSLPLETCETMNHSWGYGVTDTGYKTIEQIDSLRTKVAEMGANLLPLHRSRQ